MNAQEIESVSTSRSAPQKINTADLFQKPAVLPLIQWADNLSTSTDKSEFTVKACVQNKPEQLRLEVNGVNISVPALTRGFVPEGTFCADGVSFSQKVQLQLGQNQIVLVASNKAGEVRSKSLTVNYIKAEKRIALVIGNSNYPNGNKLANPVNDAGKIAAKLRTLGFEVIEQENTTQNDLRTVVSKFGNSLQNQKYDVAMFYYAGHGIGIGDNNYLLPVDINPQSESDVKILAVSANDILDQMNSDDNPNRANIVILDACRDNPLTRSWKSSTRGGGNKGLIEMAAPSGSLICYSTQPKATAMDGTGVDSPYAEELLKALDQPNLPLLSVFMAVRAGVQQRTNSMQRPMETNLLLRDVILNRR